jgi:hypothetical protein
VIKLAGIFYYIEPCQQRYSLIELDQNEKEKSQDQKICYNSTIVTWSDDNDDLHISNVGQQFK